MKLKVMRCTQCGAQLDVDVLERKVTCPYCGSSFLNEQEGNTGKLAQDAEVFMVKLHDYGRAAEAFRKLSELEPNSYKGWFGLARAKTRDFRDTDCVNQKVNECAGYVQQALKVANEQEAEYIRQEWGRFLAEREKFCLKKKKENERMQEKIVYLKSLIEQNNAETREVARRGKVEKAKNNGKSIFAAIGLPVSIIFFLCSSCMRMQRSFTTDMITYIMIIVFIVSIVFVVKDKKYMRREKEIEAEVSSVSHRSDDLEREIADYESQIEYNRKNYL